MSSLQADTPSSHPVDHAEALNEHHEVPNEQPESLAQLRDDLRALTHTLNTFIQQQANLPQANPPQANPPQANPPRANLPSKLKRKSSKPTHQKHSLAIELR